MLAFSLQFLNKYLLKRSNARLTRLKVIWNWYIYSWCSVIFIINICNRNRFLFLFGFLQWLCLLSYSFILFTIPELDGVSILRIKFILLLHHVFFCSYLNIKKQPQCRDDILGPSALLIRTILPRDQLNRLISEDREQKRTQSRILRGQQPTN